MGGPGRRPLIGSAGGGPCDDDQAHEHHHAKSSVSTTRVNTTISVRRLVATPVQAYPGRHAPGDEAEDRSEQRDRAAESQAGIATQDAESNRRRDRWPRRATRR